MNSNNGLPHGEIERVLKLASIKLSRMSLQPTLRCLYGQVDKIQVICVAGE